MSESTRRTSELVREFIDEDPVVKAGLQRRLINVRALARFIQEEAGTGASLEAITSAIWRYPVKEDFSASLPLGELISNLSLRDGIFAVGLANSPELWKALATLQKDIDVSRGDTLRMISGIESTTVVIDAKNKDRLYSVVPKGSVGRVFEDVAEITVNLTEPSWEGLGVLAGLSTALALAGVNILFHFGYGPPPSIVLEVSDRDAEKAYHALERLRRNRTHPRVAVR